MTWLEAFKPCFGHRAQELALRRYVQGLLSDSPRKSMEAMLARVTEPGSYQAFQHVITHAPWSADGVWRRLRAVLPEREGLLIFDATSVPQQGQQSVGVAQQYSGLQRQIATCQVAVTAALWTGARAYLLGAALYLPQAWVTEAARARARIPATVVFQQKGRLALTLLRHVRASGFVVTGGLADAEFGDNRMFRGLLHRLRLPDAVGVSSHLTAFLGTPPLQAPRATPGPHKRHLAAGVSARPISDLLAAARPRWRTGRWRNRPGGRPCTADCAAIRVTPALDYRHPRLAPEIWLLAERDVGPKAKTRFYFVNLPPTASLAQIVRFAHQRWPSNSNINSSKTELGLDHFEGRTFPGWHHHVVLTALTDNFLQAERRRTRGPLTFPWSAGSCKRSSPPISLRNDRTTSNASKRSSPSSCGSNKVVSKRVAGGRPPKTGAVSRTRVVCQGPKSRAAS
ncbi:MAG: IS701 family transposase [Luteitalea sp.]|nr:IS701 family transposase [Luteitalea sp.]